VGVCGNAEFRRTGHYPSHATPATRRYTHPRKLLKRVNIAILCKCQAPIARATLMGYLDPVTPLVPGNRDDHYDLAKSSSINLRGGALCRLR